MKLFFHLLLAVLLTLLTQIGGIVYLFSLFLKKLTPSSRWNRLWFPAVYIVTWLLLPLVATFFGRVPLPYRASAEQPLQAQHWFTVLANRHYVKPVLRDETLRVAKALADQQPGLVLTYLDANFPFWNGFPLLPHRSHDDGQKLDLAFVYKKEGQLTTEAPSFLGYGRCAEPRPGEKDQPASCAQQGYRQYSFLPVLATWFVSDRYTLAETETAGLVRAFAQSPKIGKLFIEPHLKQRWKLGGYYKIRYHGCAAVRHDDHLHIQM